jgi:hypothetical protein
LGEREFPAAIVSIQPAGDFLNWHPHLHVLSLAGVVAFPLLTT